MNRLAKLLDRKSALITEMDTLLQKAVDEDRELTEQEAKDYESMEQELDALEPAIAREKRLQERERSMEPVTDPNAGTDTSRRRGDDEDDDDHAGANAGSGDKPPKNPWNSFGEFLGAVADAGMPQGRVDERLIPQGAEGASTLVNSDGYFLVHNQFATEIFRRAYELGEFASRTDQIEIGDQFDGLEVPFIDETSRADGSRWGGVQVFWKKDGDTVTATQPKIGEMEIKLEELMGLAYVTRRLLRDARALNSIYSMAFSEETAFTLDSSIFEGTGAGQPLGILNSDALISVSKETDQPASTLTYQNIVDMWARMWGRSRTPSRAAWFINQDVEPQLLTMTIPTGTGGHPVYLPPSGASGSPFATLMGLPVIPSEHAKTLGTKGDVLLADCTQYALIRKEGQRADVSMHVRFIYDEMTFRFVFSVNGQPKWHSALTPKNGSNTLSPFVALNDRS